MTNPTSTGKQRGRPVDPNSGLNRARVLYATLPDGSNSRKEAIAAFQSQLGLSAGTAAAYFSVITRKS